MNRFASLEVERARKASQVLDEYLKEADPEKKYEFRVEIEALPARIIQNGLTQTLFMLCEMEKGDRKKLAKALIEHLGDGESQESNLLNKALSLCNNSLQTSTESALRFCYWLKLMAKAKIPKPDKEKVDNPELTEE